MKLRQPRRKKHCKISYNKPFPIIKNDDETYIYSGRFNGFGVVIDNPSEMKNINEMGFYGKGCFSRSFPNYNKQTPELIRSRQHERRKLWSEKYELESLNQPTIVVSDSDSESEDYINSLEPKLVNTLSISETLNLLLEEAYFLMTALKCLNIYDEKNELLDENTAWKLFCETQENFVQNYVVYFYFRCRDWVVKPGLKFGGDFLLYKKGPPFFHASYVIVIDVLTSDTYERKTEICRRSMDWTKLIGLNRLTETAAKEVLICQVIWPSDLTLDEAKTSPNILKSFSVNPVLMRRWIAKQQRHSKDVK